jgi:hypothetical protein
MKTISKKNYFQAAAIALLVIGICTVIFEIVAIVNTVKDSGVRNRQAILERYEELVAEKPEYAENIMTIEGCEVVLGKTSVQELLDGTGLRVDNDASYYYISDYTYEDYKYLSENEIKKMNDIDAIGSGTVNVYLNRYKTDIELTIASCVWADDSWSRTLPDLSECYIKSVTFTVYPEDSNLYKFECNGVTQGMDFDDIGRVLGSPDGDWSSYEGSTYKHDVWSIGRNVNLTYETQYTGEDKEAERYHTLMFYSY